MRCTLRSDRTIGSWGRAVVIAIRVRETGERQALNFALGTSEETRFWGEFLHSLVRRGLTGVVLVISDAHEELKAVQAEILAGATWQRRGVHFVRNVLAHVAFPRGDVHLAPVQTIPGG